MIFVACHLLRVQALSVVTEDHTKKEKPMLNISEVVNGRIYSVVFAGPVSMNQGGRGGIPRNPLLDLPVTKRTVSRVQACSRQSYVNRMRKLDPAWQPDNSGKPSGYGPTANPCVDVNLTSMDQALRGWSCGVVKHEVFVGGRPATESELATIAAYQPGGSFYPASQGKRAPGFMRLPLAKIEHEGYVDSAVDAE